MIASGGYGIKVVRKTHSEENDFCDVMYRPSMYDDPAVRLDRNNADDSEYEEAEASATDPMRRFRLANVYESAVTDMHRERGRRGCLWYLTADTVAVGIDNIETFFYHGY